jgi:hypothetical protein
MVSFPSKVRRVTVATLVSMGVMVLNSVAKFNIFFATTRALSKASRYPRELQLTSKQWAQILSAVSAHMQINTDHGERRPL